MGLSAESVKKAKRLFVDMMNNESLPCKIIDDVKDYTTGAIILFGEKSDGASYENVYMNFQEIDQSILDYFYDWKHEIPNSHFINYKENGIIQIGWF